MAKRFSSCELDVQSFFLLIDGDVVIVTDHVLRELLSQRGEVNIVVNNTLFLHEPFHRFVGGSDMITDLKYPLKDNTMPFSAVLTVAIILHLLVILVVYFIKRDVYDVNQAILGLLHSILITSVIIDAVGRPCLDFLWRCFPDGKGVFDPITNDVKCTVLKSVIKGGHKSFPNGHSSSRMPDVHIQRLAEQRSGTQSYYKATRS
ncbi:lipid phosphate phosphatase 2-like [Lycium barbarum]|uniref:lipid phosphate phosphatase 2-like n=1 Tax=Lycium barbarum TaxID=112863 RepID=UPI00293F0672|nr:lipid phosphate phosphatase 2-like [Lycium barbarum]